MDLKTTRIGGGRDSICTDLNSLENGHTTSINTLTYGYYPYLLENANGLLGRFLRKLPDHRSLNPRAVNHPAIVYCEASMPPAVHRRTARGRSREREEEEAAAAAVT